MHTTLHGSPFARLKAASISLIAIGGLFFSSCATTSTSEPDPAATTTTQSEAEFYTPGPSGEADDYWLYFDDEDDVEYSYYLDKEHYVYIVNDHDDKDDKAWEKRWKKRIKNGHGYGDANHIHIHWKEKHHGERIHVDVDHHDWTDSLQLTQEQKLSIDTAMKEFKECAKESLDSFKVLFKPYRDQFRAEKKRILGLLDSNLVTRDSAYMLLDSAIERYETQTEFLKAGLQVELQSCYQELDAFMMTRLTPAQYDLWKRNRGW